MKHVIVTVAFVLTAVLVAACGVKGNGEIVEESRDVSGFNQIELSGVGILNVTQGETESLTISAESNLMSLLRSDVRGETLILDTQQNKRVNPTRDIVYTISVKDLSRIEISGVGTVNLESLETQSFSIILSGASNITIGSLNADSLQVESSGAGSISLAQGSVKNQEITISGAGNYEARGLQSETAHITISGAGSATVSVSNDLSGDISGFGSINYVGNPRMDVAISGAGTTHKLADK